MWWEWFGLKILWGLSRLFFQIWMIFWTSFIPCKFINIYVSITRYTFAPHLYFYHFYKSLSQTRGSSAIKISSYQLCSYLLLYIKKQVYIPFFSLGIYFFSGIDIRKLPLFYISDRWNALFWSAFGKILSSKRIA